MNWVVIGAYVLAASYGKTFAHEGGHVLALAITDRLLRKRNIPDYMPHKTDVRIHGGMGRADSKLYGFLAENKLCGLIRFNAISGVLGEFVFCSALYFLTKLFGIAPLSFFIFWVFILVSLALFFGTFSQPHSDIRIILFPAAFMGIKNPNFFSKSTIFLGCVRIAAESSLVILLSFACSCS